jgi:uncharacterized protein
MVRAYFLDSSALVKRYVAEVGSEWVRGIADPADRNQLIIARVTWVEVVSALARRGREGVLPNEAVARAIDAFQYDLDTQYQVVELDQEVAMTAGQLVLKHPLRAYDAVQLASVQRIQPVFAQVAAGELVFLTADERLLAIAESEGITADNPNRHL